MRWYDVRVTASDILREAARLLLVDGWQPHQDVIADGKPSNGRFYTECSMSNAILRAYRCLRASWYDQTRAFDAVYKSLKCPGRGVDLKKWERTPGRDLERVVRAILRAAFQFDSGVLAV